MRAGRNEYKELIKWNSSCRERWLWLDALSRAVGPHPGLIATAVPTRVSGVFFLSGLCGQRMVVVHHPRAVTISNRHQCALSHAWRVCASAFVAGVVRTPSVSGAAAAAAARGECAPRIQTVSMQCTHLCDVETGGRADGARRGRRLTCNLQKWLREQAKQRNTYTTTGRAGTHARTPINAYLMYDIVCS